VVTEFAHLENALVIWDFLEQIVLTLHQFTLVQIIVQEEDIVVRLTHRHQHSNAFVMIASVEWIVLEHAFSAQEIDLDREFVNVMELVHAKVDLLELLVNKLLTLVPTYDFVLETEFAQMEHAVAILDSLESLVL